MNEADGSCAFCDSIGKVGQPCNRDTCSSRGYHFIPTEFFEKIHNVTFQARDPNLGLLIDDFLIVEKIGEGGFGKVYLALQLPVLMKAALKLMTDAPSDASARVSLLKKFEGEALSLARLNHPNIVRLHKYGTFGNMPYLVMEFVEGARTLKKEVAERAMRGQGFDHELLEHLVVQVLNALECAHSHSIVHRDMKPENVMLQEVAGNPDMVRVLDFGLAKFVDEGTATSMVMGTPLYMAPEQMTARNIGPWTDLYAVGAITFEMMTGRHPFSGRTQQEILSKKLDPAYDPAVRILDLSLPDLTLSFFRKALARDVEDRFRNTGEFRDSLKLVFQGLEAEKQHSGRNTREEVKAGQTPVQRPPNRSTGDRASDASKPADIAAVPRTETDKSVAAVLPGRIREHRPEDKEVRTGSPDVEPAETNGLRHYQAKSDKQVEVSLQDSPPALVSRRLAPSRRFILLCSGIVAILMVAAFAMSVLVKKRGGGEKAVTVGNNEADSLPRKLLTSAPTTSDVMLPAPGTKDSGSLDASSGDIGATEDLKTVQQFSPSYSEANSNDPFVIRIVSHRSDSESSKVRLYAMLQTSTEEILPPMFKPQVSGFHVQSGYFEPVITRIGTFGGKEGLGSGATAVVLVDVSFATAAHWDRLREAALAFIDTMGEEDEVAILFVGQTFVTSGMRRYDERNVLREFVARTLPDAVVEQSPAIRDSGVDASLWPEKLLTPVGLDPKGNELFDVLERYALPLAVSSDSELPSLILFSGGRNFGNAAALSLEAVEQLAKAARNQRVRVFALGQMEVDSEGTVQNRSELALLQKLCDETLGVYQETAYFTEPSTLFPGAKEMLVDRLVVVDVEFRGIPENVGELSATNYLTLRYRDEEAGIDVESMSWKVPTLGAKREATTASARVDTTVRIGAPRGEDEDRAGVGDDEHTRNGACSKLDALNEELEAIDSLSVSECRIWRSRVAEYRPPACRRADGQTRYRAFVQLVGTLCRHAHEKACGIQVKELDKVWNRGPRPNCSVMKTQLDVLTHDACNLHELKTRNGVPTGVIGMLRSLEQSIRKDCGIDEEVMPQSKAEEGMKADEARPKTETVAGERADDWPEESFEMPPTSVATDFCRNANASALQCACYISCSKALKDAFGKAEESIEAGIHPEGCYSLFDKSSAVWKVCRQDADCLSFEETASLWHQFLRVMKYKCYKAVGTEPKSVGFN